MAAPTNAAKVKILLANPEPSTHGPPDSLRGAGICPKLGAHPTPIEGQTGAVGTQS